LFDSYRRNSQRFRHYGPEGLISKLIFSFMRVRRYIQKLQEMIKQKQIM